jgi:hypothetical protein
MVMPMAMIDPAIDPAGAELRLDIGTHLRANLAATGRNLRTGEGPGAKPRAKGLHETPGLRRGEGGPVAARAAEIVVIKANSARHRIFSIQKNSRR